MNATEGIQFRNTAPNQLPRSTNNKSINCPIDKIYGYCAKGRTKLIKTPTFELKDSN